MAGPDEVAIIGSGGIGGYLAGALVRAGRRPTLCARTPFDRLVVEEGGEARAVDVALAADPAAVGPARWVLLTTKAQDVAGAAPWLRALAGLGSTVVVVQNGVDHARRATPHLPAGAALLPAIIYCSVERTAPGRIVHHGGARLHVPAGPDGEAFAALMAGSGFKVAQETDFVTSAWRKLLSNAVANPVTALTLRRSAVFAEEPVRRLAEDLAAEVVAVARAEGAALAREDADAVLAGFGRGGAGGSSMLYDRLAGRALEHEYLTGAVVEAADRHGIAVPHNRTLLALLAAASGRPLDGSA